MRARVTAVTAQAFDDLLLGAQLGVLTAASTFPGAVEDWVCDLLAEHGPVPLLPPESAAELGLQATACTVGLVGSMAALYEFPPHGDEPMVVVRRLERMVGTHFSAIAPLNAAGCNAFLAVAAACLLDLPLLDCDGQGKVHPFLDQTTFTLGGVSATPLVGVGPWGDVVSIESPLHRGEPVERSALAGTGGWLFTALYPAPISELTAHGIPGAVSRTLRAGAILRSGRGRIGARLASELGGRLVGRGRVVDIRQYPTSETPVRQPTVPISIRLQGTGPVDSEILIEVRHETVLALVDGAIAGSAPDVTCLLDPLRGRAVDLLDLQVGDVVDVLLVPAHSRWHTPDGLALAGPGAFGLRLPPPRDA